MTDERNMVDNSASDKDGSDADSSDALGSLSNLPDFSALESFASALWQDEAAIMIGAGFSRLCDRELDSPVPPLWSDFQTEMKKALRYGCRDAPETLRLAQEYHAQHGDVGLDRLIRTLVADDQWQPGELHQQLLELPWQDVLTTNWDTLLERTKPQNPDRIYNCVRTVQDIARQRRPRIVKLHGSLPSYKPFIFTEDEFRTYPTRFAPFVNLAQQVMLENELCLLGFSGDDPNFLAWSGWVRDTLDVSARHIRLVGVLNLSPVSRRLLEARNVTPIDLAPLVQNIHPDERHLKALKLFFDELRRLEPPSPFSWTASQLSAANGSSEEQGAKRSEIAELWQEDRHKYPGWLVAPYEATCILHHDFPEVREQNEAPEVHLAFAAQRIWRCRVSRTWLVPEDMQEADIHYEDGWNTISPSDRIELCVSIAAEHRRYQNWDEWGRWMTRLEAIAGCDARLNHAYETAQRALLNWDDASIERAADTLRSDKPIWMMLRAGLLATLFQHRDAAKLYQAALLSIRQKLLSASKSAWLVSLEGWAAMFHRVSKAALSDENHAFPLEGESTETRLRFLEAKADPWAIISRLENLASQRIDRNRNDREPWELEFRPGLYRPEGTIRLGRDNECPFYGLLDLLERTGAPENIAKFNVFSTRIETAYRTLKCPAEHDLMTFLGRYRGTEKRNLDWIMPRIRVARLSDGAVEHLLSAIPKRLDRLIAPMNRPTAQSHIAWLLELLARVVIRSNPKTALEIFERIVSLLGEDNLPWVLYAPCGKVLESAVLAMGTQERLKALYLAINLETPGEASGHTYGPEWPYVMNAFTEQEFADLEVSSADSARISSLISLVNEGAKSERDRALRWLYYLHNAQKLSDEQKRNLETAIWARRNESGWPDETYLQPWVFLKLPGQDRANPLFMEQIVGAVSGGKVGQELLIDLREALNLDGIQVEKKVIAECARSCLNWKPTSNEGRNEASFLLSSDLDKDTKTARAIGKALAQSLLPRLDAADIPEDVARILQDAERRTGIKSIAAVAFQLVRLWPEQKPGAISLIRSALASHDPERVNPTYLAMRQFIEGSAPNSPVPREIKEALLNTCEQRIQPGLSSAIDLMTKIASSGHLLHEDIARLERAVPDIIEEYQYSRDRLSVPSLADLPIVRKNVRHLLEYLPDEMASLQNLKAELANDPLPEVRNIDS